MQEFSGVPYARFASRIGATGGLCLLAALLLLWASPASGAGWRPHADLVLSPGSGPTRGYVELFMPVLQNQRGMWFTNIRGVLQEDYRLGVTAGLGYRRILRNGGWITGGYGFYTRRRSEDGNILQQGVLGIEALSPAWDLRSNVYIPERKKHVLRTVERFGGALLEQVYERPMLGFDAEVGRALPWVSQTRAYATGFHFRTQGRTHATGGGVRIEKRVSRFTMGGSLEYDNLRGFQGTVNFRFRFSPFGRSRNREEMPVEPRMTHFVVFRDMEVISARETLRDTRTPPESDPLTSPQDGDPTGGPRGGPDPDPEPDCLVPGTGGPITSWPPVFCTP